MGPQPRRLNGLKPEIEWPKAIHSPGARALLVPKSSGRLPFTRMVLERLVLERLVLEAELTSSLIPLHAALMRLIGFPRSGIEIEY